MTGRVRVLGWWIVLPPDPDALARECPVCGFDALLPFPVCLLTAAGVRRLEQPYWSCARCEAESTQDPG